MSKNLRIKIEYRYIIAAIYTVVLILDRLDLTIVNIALPALGEFFNVPITETEWVNNSYLLALAISIPISGWVGGRFGFKKVFIISTILFGLASLSCAFSPNLTIMAIMRFLQGIGGGIIVPLGSTMVYRAFHPSEYASITSFIFIPTLIAPAIAPALGGVIIHYFGWEWVFLFAVPICFIITIVSMIMLKEEKGEDKIPLDWLGFLLSSCAFILILYFISSLEKSANYLQIISVLIAAVFCSYMFLRYEKNTKFPLIDIKFFKNELFLQANLIQLAFQICHFGSIFLIVMYLQVGVGMSAMAAGVIIGMQAIGAVLTSRYSVKLFRQFGPGRPVIIGFIGVGLLTPSILFINSPQMILIGCFILLIRGVFSGLCGTPIQTASIIGFKKEDIGRASAIFNAGRQIAISLGIALTSLLITYGFKLNGLDVLQETAQPGRAVFYYAFMLVPIVSFLGILMTAQINNKKIISLTTKRKIKN